MTWNLAGQYRQWFEYEKDSHRKVLASLMGVPAASRASAAFQKAADLVAHIVAARMLWLYRFGVAPRGPNDLFPRNVPFDALPSQLQEMESGWDAYLAALDDAEAEREFTYRSLEGEWFHNRVADILTQLFGHSWYHRGQVAALVRSLGCEPAATDYVFWSRRPAPPPESCT